MVYSEVVKNGWILPRKEKYTMRDVRKVAKEMNITESQARFIVVCSGIYHDADYSKYIGSYHSPENQIKRMVGNA